MKTCDILFSQEKEKDVKKRDDQINKKNYSLIFVVLFYLITVSKNNVA